MKKLYIDVESTGLDKQKHSIHQISGSCYVENKNLGKFDLKFQPRPGCEYDESALEKTRLSKKELQNRKISYKKAFLMFLKILEKFEVDKNDKIFFCAYNAHFDKDFIIQFFKDNEDFLPDNLKWWKGKFLFGKYFWSDCQDVLPLASYFLAPIRHKMKNFKLTTVYETMCYLDLIKVKDRIDTSNAHDALCDIKMTEQIEYVCLNNVLKI